jgi:hypothetical protein
MRGPRSDGFIALIGGSLLVAGVLGIAVALLTGVGDTYQRQLESESWAEQRCQAFAPIDTVDSPEWQACIDEQLAQPIIRAEREAVFIGLGGMALGLAGGLVLTLALLPERSRRARRAAEPS